jgi:hypothetical protein
LEQYVRDDEIKRREKIDADKKNVSIVKENERKTNIKNDRDDL